MQRHRPYVSIRDTQDSLNLNRGEALLLACPVLSPSAIEYTGPIAITRATRLIVRAWNPTPVAPVGSGWSAPSVFSYSLN